MLSSNVSFLLDDLWNIIDDSGLPPTVTVKHRLGIRDAGTFDAANDRAKNDELANGLIEKKQKELHSILLNVLNVQ